MTYREGVIKETEFFTTAELAKKLKMNVQVITRKVQAGEIEAYKIGKDWRIPEQSVHAWLERQSNRNGLERQPATPTVPEREASATAPPQRTKRKFLLEYILAQFEPRRRYPEEEVDRIIARYHNDFENIRREFVEERMMEQSDGTYRRRAGYRFSD